MLAFAAEQSFQVIAVVPVVLSFVFGVVWMFERRHRFRSDQQTSMAVGH